MEKNKNQGVYMIGIASKLTGSHPQTLRMYERLGLIKPSRTEGKTRLYSDEDIERIKEIQHLTQDLGINLAGVDMILNMTAKMKKMQQQINKVKHNINKRNYKVEYKTK